MSLSPEQLDQLRRHEAQAHNYSTSSRWFVNTGTAISYLRRARAAQDPRERFWDAWSAAYNLLMLHGGRGEEEANRLGAWIQQLKQVPEVRRIVQEAPLAECVQAIRKAEKALLYDRKSDRWREGRERLAAWDGKEPPSPDRAIGHFLTIMRDVRNAVGHPELNLDASATRRALESAARCLLPIVEAAAEAMLLHPAEGTTGKATAYRFFLWPFLRNSGTFFSDYYLERVFPDDELGAFLPDAARETLKDLGRRIETDRTSLAGADAARTGEQWCEAVLFPALGMKEAALGPRIVAEGAVFEPTYALPRANVGRAPRTEYRGREAGRDLAALIWVLPWRASLDAVADDPAFPGRTVMDICQQALLEADVPWAVLTNGRQLRLFSKTTAHQPRNLLEADLDAMAAQRGEPRAQFAFRYFLALFSGPSFTAKDERDRTLLERVLEESERHGQEIGKELKRNVFGALEELGEGFLHFLRERPEAAERWRNAWHPGVPPDQLLTSDELLQEIYHESLSLMYRLLFLFYAESRNLLPMEDEIYRETYSLESLRDEIIARHDDPDPRQFFGRGTADLWDRLQELFRMINKGQPGMVHAYNGGLFDPARHPFLEAFKVPDFFLASAVDLVSRTQPLSGQARGEGRRKVTYRDLDVRHLGSIYEGILEYHAHVAREDQAVMKRGSGSKTFEEYVPADELPADEREQLRQWRQAVDEDPDNPRPPRGCRVAGFKSAGSYFLVHGGRESTRKSSGSYYTPEYIVQYIVENTLGPLVRGECRPQPEPVSPEVAAALERLKAHHTHSPTHPLTEGPLTPEEILDLKVLDPAMGSGHFLVAATEYLARAYGEALVRAGRDADGQMTDDEFIRYKRIVAERCIYGVDANEMAVELAKLSLWLFTMDPGRPLSFLDHHLKWGNSLLGARIADLGAPPVSDRRGRVSKRSTDPNQLNLFEQRFREKVPLMVRDLFRIMDQETLTEGDVRLKKQWDAAIREIKEPFRNVADVWTAAFFGEEPRDYDALLTDQALARERKTAAAGERRFFHWELEFPEVFFSQNGSPRERPGFDAVVGNPPYVRQELLTPLKGFLSGAFLSFDSAADLYLYFYEKGLLLARYSGRLSYISSGTFARGRFAAEFRKVLPSLAHLVSIIDFGENQPFDGAEMVRPTIIVAGRGMGTARFRSLFMARQIPSSLRDALQDEGVDCDPVLLQGAEWTFQSDEGARLLSKIRVSSQVLADVAPSGIYRGLTTGLNELYVLDRSSYDSISEDGDRARALLKPSVRGEDLRPWYQEDEDRWMLVLPSGWTRLELGNGLSEEDAWGRLQDLLPALSRYLAPYRDAARQRYDQGEFWWELRSCDYYDAFEGDKIFWPDIAKLPRFSWDSSGRYINNTGYVMPVGEPTLLGILQSRVTWYALSQFCQPLRLRGGLWQYRLLPQFLSRLPVPQIGDADREAIGSLATGITKLAQERYALHQKVRAPIRGILEGSGKDLGDKLAAWWELDFSALRKSLEGLLRRPLSTKELAEWEGRLAAGKREHERLTARIVELETELNDRVYRLFDLTPEEIRIIEETTKYRYGEV